MSLARHKSSPHIVCQTWQQVRGGGSASRKLAHAQPQVGSRPAANQRNRNPRRDAHRHSHAAQTQRGLPETKVSVLETCLQGMQTPSRDATSGAAPAPLPRPCTRTAVAARRPAGWAAGRRPGWRKSAPSPRSSCSVPAGVERGWRGLPVRAQIISQCIESVLLVMCLSYRE